MTYLTSTYHLAKTSDAARNNYHYLCNLTVKMIVPTKQALAAVIVSLIGVGIAAAKSENDIRLVLGPGTKLVSSDGEDLLHGPGVFTFEFADPWNKGDKHKFKVMYWGVKDKIWVPVSESDRTATKA